MIPHFPVMNTGPNIAHVLKIGFYKSCNENAENAIKMRKLRSCWWQALPSSHVTSALQGSHMTQALKKQSYDLSIKYWAVMWLSQSSHKCNKCGNASFPILGEHRRGVCNNADILRCNNNDAWLWQGPWQWLEAWAYCSGMPQSWSDVEKSKHITFPDAKMLKANNAICNQWNDAVCINATR